MNKLPPGEILDNLLSKIYTIPKKNYSTKFIDSMYLLERMGKEGFQITYNKQLNFRVCKVVLNTKDYYLNTSAIGESGYIPYSICLAILDLICKPFLKDIEERGKFKAIRSFYSEYSYDFNNDEILTNEEIRLLIGHFLNG